MHGTWEGASRHCRPRWRGGRRESAKRLNRKAVSTVAGRAGGPARSSGEASAGCGGGGAKGPGHPWCVRLINRERASGRSSTDRLKPSGCICVRGSGGQDDKSPVTRDCHAGICGSRRVKLPPATRQMMICRFSNLMSNSQSKCPLDVQLDMKVRIPVARRDGVSIPVTALSLNPWISDFVPSRG